LKLDSPAVLDASDRTRVIQGYQRRIAKFGATFESLNSGSIEKQRIRHQIHASVLSGTSPAVLDIGCGLAEFYGYLKAVGRDCSYNGCDIVPEYIAACRQQYPEASFEVRDIFRDSLAETYDTIVMSQVLNNRYQSSDNMEVMKAALSMAFQHARSAVSVDMMSSYVDFQNPELFYYSPEEIFRFAKSLTRRVVLRHDYRPFEFCIQLLHDNAPNYVP
jgi:SAM-dependent methyltransferase